MKRDVLENAQNASWLTRSYKAAGFPGLYRPGLIEARQHNLTAFNTPAGFPGLYRPGLIEARPAP